ncbi:MAG: hypothetical protein HY560_06050 [Gemmatimonadetes bacterium]|nr:hypothetical protein [Gemmatimonadota bacterium]
MSLTLAACGGPVEPLTDCLFWQSAPQLIAAHDQTAIAFDVSNCGIAATTTEFTLPAGGTWLMIAQIVWEPNGDGARGICLKNRDAIVVQGNGVPLAAGAGGAGTTLTLTAVVRPKSGDVFTLYGTQTSQTSLATLAGIPEMNRTQLQFVRLH